MRSRWIPVAALLIGVGGLPVGVAAAADDGGVGAARARADAAAAAWSAAQSKLDLLDQQIDDLRSAQASTTAELARLRTAVQAVAVRRYVQIDSSGIAWFLGGDINEQVRADALARFVTQGTDEAIDRYRAANLDLRAESATLDRAVGDQKAAVAALAGTRQALETELDQLVQLEAQRQAAELARQQAEAARRAAAARTTTTIARVARTTVAKTAGATPTVAVPTLASSDGATTTVPDSGAPPAPVLTGGDWICPVAGPHAFSDDFGAPRENGSKHQGNDILAKRGTPVVAPVAGSVSLRDSSLGGHSFFLKGVDDNEYFGAHMDAWQGVSRTVHAGEVLGYVGTTGDAAGGPPHLHFEIHPHGGAAIDPYPTLKAHC